MRRYTPYILTSLAFHALLALMLVPLPQAPQRPAVSQVVFDLLPVEISPPTAIQTPAKAPPKPNIEPIPAPKTSRNTSSPTQQSEPSPQKSQTSIMVKKQPSLSQTLGRKRQWSTKPNTRQNSQDVNALVKKRLADLTAPFKDPPRQRHIIPPAFAKTASEGAAFYAAYASGNVPAMVAVTGLSLTGGTLKKGLGKAVKLFKPSKRDSSAVRPNIPHPE